MATVLTNLGVHDISGAAIKTIVDAHTLVNGFTSGQFYFVPCGNNQQVQILAVQT